MKKRVSIIVIIIIAAIAISACSKSIQTLSVSELLDLGEKYLLDSNYEQALIQFNKVIEIEPMNARGYTGAAEAYIGLEKFDEAVAILQKGFEQTQDDEIRNMLDTLVLNYEMDNSSELTSEQKELIQQLAKALASEDFQFAASIAGSGTYLQLVEKASENGSIIHDVQNTNLIIYPNGFVYCGELNNNLRSGFGIWFNGLSEEGNIYYYKGQWMNDLPNGEGAIYQVMDINYLEKREEGSYALYTEEVGAFIDGYYDGTFSTTWNMDNGEVHYWTPTYDSGIAQIMPDTEIREEGYDIAICINCGANLVSIEGYLYYVIGFENTDITHEVQQSGALTNSEYKYYHYLQMYDNMSFKISYEEGGLYSYYHEIILDEPLIQVDSPYAEEGYPTYGHYRCTIDEEGFTDDMSLWYKAD